MADSPSTVIGRTRSGKDIHSPLPSLGITNAIHVSNVGFTDDDLLDAYAVFEHHCMEELRRIGSGSDALICFSAQPQAFFNLLVDRNALESAKGRAAVRTSIQIRELSRLLAL